MSDIILLFQVYRVADIQPKKKINVKTYQITGNKLDAFDINETDVADVDNLCKAASKKAINYIHNLYYEPSVSQDMKLFHNPAAIRSPLTLLRRENRNTYPGLGDDWFFMGKRLTSSFMHTDDLGIPVINTMLNDGKKLWMVVDPIDNAVLIQKLRTISG